MNNLLRLFCSALVLVISGSGICAQTVSVPAVPTSLLQVAQAGGIFIPLPILIAQPASILTLPVQALAPAEIIRVKPSEIHPAIHAGKGMTVSGPRVSSKAVAREIRRVENLKISPEQVQRDPVGSLGEFSRFYDFSLKGREAGNSSAVAAVVASEPKPLHLIILGPPGSGKSTYARRLADDFGIVHISAGDLVREYAKAHPEIDEIVRSGRLVPVELVVGLVEERLAKQDIKEKGFILDGFPRRVEETRLFMKMLDRFHIGLDKVILLKVPQNELQRRILERGRPDDNKEVFKRRMDIYRKETNPVIRFMKDKIGFLSPKVSGQGIEENYLNVKKSLSDSLEQ